MRVSRMPEYRGGSGSPLILILVLVAVLIVGAVVIYFLIGGTNEASPAPVEPAVAPATAPAVIQPPAPVDPVAIQRPAVAPPAPAPVDPAPVEPAQMGNGGPQPFQPPEVLYGEVLSEGFVDLQLSVGVVRTYYTFQVDTSTQNIVLFFALYDPTGMAISRSVVVEDYTPAELISNAQLTVYYPDAPSTVIRFSRESGTVEASQFYTTQPHGPGLLSSQMRIALIRQNLPLVNADGDINAAIQLDPTGVADLSGYRILISDQFATETGLSELQQVIDQLESRRPRS